MGSENGYQLVLQVRMSPSYNNEVKTGAIALNLQYYIPILLRAQKANLMFKEEILV